MTSSGMPTARAADHDTARTRRESVSTAVPSARPERDSSTRRSARARRQTHEQRRWLDLHSHARDRAGAARRASCRRRRTPASVASRCSGRCNCSTVNSPRPTWAPTRSAARTTCSRAVAEGGGDQPLPAVLESLSEEIDDRRAGAERRGAPGLQRRTGRGDRGPSAPADSRGARHASSG